MADAPHEPVAPKRSTLHAADVAGAAMTEPRPDLPLRGSPAGAAAAALEVRLAAAVIGPLAALGVAGGLAGLRDELGTANVGFLMTVIVLAAGWAGGRWVGVGTAVVAALAFNLFHTQPYLRLSVAARQDVLSVALLGVVGAVVGEVGARAGQRRRALAALSVLQRDLDLILDEVAAGASLPTCWQDVRSVLTVHGGIERVRFRRLDGHGDAPVDGADLERTYVVPVHVRGAEVGRLQLVLPGDRIDRVTAELARRAAALLALAFVVHGEVPPAL